MSIRSRLLVLLLLISLLPLAGLTGIFQLSGKHLGEQVAGNVESALVSRAERYLGEKSLDYAMLIRRQIQILELAVQQQGQGVATLLATDPLEGSHRQLVSVVEFDAGRVPTKVSAAYSRLLADGEVIPLQVSGQRAVYRVTDGRPDAAVESDLRRLDSLAEVYRRVSRLQPDTLLWQYATLKNGLHISWPGHGDFPAAFDPRKRPWYLNARDQSGPVWSEPYVDAVTRRVVFTVSIALRDADQEFLGVTAIDVPAENILQVEHISPEWAAGTRVLIANHDRRDGRPAIRVRSLQDYRAAGLNWEQPLQPVWLAPGEEGPARLFADPARPATAQKVSYQGEEALWAVTPVEGTRMFVALVVPWQQITSTVASVNSRFSELVEWQLVVAAVAFLAVTLLVVWIAIRSARRVTEPVKALSRTTSEIARGDYSSRVTVESSDEIGALGESVNSMAASIESLQREQEEAYLQSLQSLYKALASKDTYTASHSGRVTRNSVALGERIGLPEEELEQLRKGAWMHDLGKIGIPDAVLNKPAPLTDEEFEVMKKHPEYTVSIMRPLKRFKAFSEIGGWHHERWDGKGYPDGLKGEEIPLLARIVAIADTWDAMIGDRVYRKGMPVEKALGILDRERDSGQWDPELLDQFIAMIREQDGQSSA